MSPNGAITRATSRFRPAWSPSRRPNITAPLKGLTITPLGSPDAYAPAAGFARGWPVAYDPKAGTANLAHCYAHASASAATCRPIPAWAASFMR